MQQIILKYESRLRDLFESEEQVNFIEVGSERGHGSTQNLAEFCKTLGFKFITVDATPSVTQNAKGILELIDPTFEAHNDLGEEFLKKYDSPIHVLYLDAFDLEHMSDRAVGSFVESTHGQYVDRGVELTNENCYKCHLQMAQNAIDKMAKNGIIFFDDVYSDEPDWDGKGKTAIPFLLDNGFEIIEREYPQLLLQKK